MTSHPSTTNADRTVGPSGEPRRERLLINWVYYQAVGHAIEAYKMAAQVAAVNPDLEVCVLLNATTAVDLAPCVPGLARVYPIDVEERPGPSGVRPSLAAVPPEWDYIFTDPRHDRPSPWPELNQFQAEARAYLHAPVVNQGWHCPGFPRSRTVPLRLHLPPEAHAYAEGVLAPGQAPRISLLFSPGSHGYKMPPLAFWRLLIRALLEEFPPAEIVLLGALDRRRSYSLYVTAEDLAVMEQEFPQVRNAYDVGLLNQLAIAERCDLHVSPHTGFSFAVQCVGTPWLVLSGGNSREYVLNGVPFACVYPRCDRYPCTSFGASLYRPMLPECQERMEARRPVLCAETGELASRLPEILEHARALIRKERPYVECVREHYESLRTRIGVPAGTTLMSDWPAVLTEAYTFDWGRGMGDKS